MKNFFRYAASVLLLLGTGWLQPVAAQIKLADYAFGGAGNDGCTGSLLTADGGLLLSGTTDSGVGNDVTEPLRGAASKYNVDYWLVKTTSQGTRLWDKRFGGAAQDYLTTVLATADGGYLLCGDSYSGLGYDKSEASRGNSDYWLVKVNAQGEKQWDKTYGSSGQENLNAAVTTPDGGVLLVGTSFGSPPSGDRTMPMPGSFGLWVVKLDAAGNKQWDKAYGSASGGYAAAVVRLPGGGYALGGSVLGTGGDVTARPRDGGAADYWVVGLDAAGNKQWDRFYGGSQLDNLQAMVATADGGLLLGGQSRSPASGDKSQGGNDNDWWVVKLDATGNKQWDQTYGPPRPSNSTSLSNPLAVMQQTPQGGYLLAGYSGWYGPASPEPDDVPYRYWLVATTATGAVQRQQILSSNGSDSMLSGLVQQGTTLWLTGSSSSGVGGDRTAPDKGGADFWIVKEDAAVLAGRPEKAAGNWLDVFPNPVSVGTLTIRLAGMQPQQPAQLQLLNALGQTVQMQSLTVPAAGAQYELSASDLVPGIYTLRLQTASGIYVSRFVKE